MSEASSEEFEVTPVDIYAFLPEEEEAEDYLVDLDEEEAGPDQEDYGDTCKSEGCLDSVTFAESGKGNVRLYFVMDPEGSTPGAFHVNLSGHESGESAELRDVIQKTVASIFGIKLDDDFEINITKEVSEEHPAGSADIPHEYVSLSHACEVLTSNELKRIPAYSREIMHAWMKVLANKISNLSSVGLLNVLVESDVSAEDAHAFLEFVSGPKSPAGCYLNAVPARILEAAVSLRAVLYGFNQE